MTDESTRRQQLEAAGKRATEKQPDEIHLCLAPEPTSVHAEEIEGHARALRELGFTEAGSYTVDVLPVTIRFLVKESDCVYAAIYEHPKVGVWLNLIILHEDGTSVTFTNTQDRGLEKRPGHPVFHFYRTTAAQLFAMVQQAAGGPQRRAVSAATIPAEFEKAWTDGVRWRKSRSFTTTEVASVLISREGNPARVLRKDRIRYIAEQDGPPERDLKEALRKVLDVHQSVDKAYLALVSYDNAEIGVALCLTSASPDDSSLMDDICKTFAAAFKKGTHLDILFISASDLPGLERVCPPFYMRMRARQ